jgi:hypothetical protein
MKIIATILMAGALCVGVAVAQDSTTTSTQTTPKQDMKSAGHDTKNAAKDVGHATKKTTKKVVHKTAEKTDEGASKVESKTAPNQ